jgi:AcrR family transcriptional regulator
MPARQRPPSPAPAAPETETAPVAPPVGQLRNKGFQATHEAIIETAVRLIAQSGVDALSMAAIARAAKVNRATLYYHFADRQALLIAVMEWSSQQLTRGFAAKLPRAERTAHISRFVLNNPALITMWIEDFISPGDIRARYPEWDALVASMATHLAHHPEPIDPEIYCTVMLTAAFIAPRVYRNSVRPDLPIDTVVERFMREQLRVMARDAQLDER